MPEDTTNDEHELLPRDDAPPHDQQADGGGISAQDEGAGQPAETISIELAEANGRALRAQAELENFRKRIRREMDEQQRYAITPLLREILPVVDDMQRAIAAAEKSSDAASLLEGVKMVEARLRSVLGQHGCRMIEAHGTPFDPAQHEAILQQPSSEHEPGSVMQVTQQGYQLHDRVIRPAQVIVSQEPENSETTS